MTETSTQLPFPQKTGQPSYEYQTFIFRSSARNCFFTKVVWYLLIHIILNFELNLTVWSSYKWQTKKSVIILDSWKERKIYIYIYINWKREQMDGVSVGLFKENKKVLEWWVAPFWWKKKFGKVDFWCMMLTQKEKRTKIIGWYMAHVNE